MARDGLNFPVISGEWQEDVGMLSVELATPPWQDAESCRGGIFMARITFDFS